MSDNNFDQRLKSVLENLEQEYDPATWDMLARKMDTAAFEEQPAAVDAVDKAVYHTLHRLETPYQSAHWQILADRLVLIATRVRRLRIAKFAEAAILLLLLWNTESYWGTDTAPALPKPHFDPSVPVAQLEPGVRRANSYNGNHQPAVSDAATPLQVLAPHVLNAPLVLPGTESLLSENYVAANSAAQLLLDLNATANQARSNLYAATLPLPPQLLALSTPMPERPLGLPQVPLSKTKTKGPFYLSSYAVADQDRIRSADGNYSGNGYGLVLAAGFRPDKWGVEAGIGYSSKQYSPKQKVDIYAGNSTDGYYGSSLSGVSADMLAVPLKVTRRIAKMGRTSAHAVAGATLQVAMNKNFDYDATFFPPGSLPPNLLPDPNQAPQLRKAGKGLLENGSLADNLLVSLDAGLRIEHQIGKGRLTAFVEPAYRKAIAGKGYGPGQEPVNSFSIQAGVLTYL